MNGKRLIIWVTISLSLKKKKKDGEGKSVRRSPQTKIFCDVLENLQNAHVSLNQRHYDLNLYYILNFTPMHTHPTLGRTPPTK